MCFRTRRVIDWAKDTFLLFLEDFLGERRRTLSEAWDREDGDRKLESVYWVS